VLDGDGGLVGLVTASDLLKALLATAQVAQSASRA
jgi:CBS-domain-containing membrane protein